MFSIFFHNVRETVYLFLFYTCQRKPVIIYKVERFYYGCIKVTSLFVIVILTIYESECTGLRYCDHPVILYLFVVPGRYQWLKRRDFDSFI